MKIVYPNNPDYNSAREVVNKDHEGLPDAIIFCESNDDVVSAVKLSRDDKKNIRVRSGRHSYEGFSSGGKGTYIIDVSALNEVSVSSDQKTALVGAGGQLYEDVYLPLWEKGKTTIPAGSCPTVGVSGLVAGGGFSFSGRHFGLTCDSVESLTIVTADGQCRTISASDKETSDLFWACCGAGNGNYGIITQFNFKIYPADDVSIFRLTFDWDKDKVVGVSNAWAKMISQEPPSLMGFLRYTTASSNPILSVFGQYYGSQADLEKIISKYFSSFKTSEMHFDSLSNIDAIRFWGGVKEGMTSAPLKEYHKPHQHGSLLKDMPFPMSTFKASSVMLDRFFNESELEFIYDTFTSNNQSGGFVVLDSHYNGFSSNLPKDKNAYAHRGAFASVQIYKTWMKPEDRQTSIDWVRNIREKLSSAGKGAYCNYPDLLIEDFQTAYYGDHYERLQEIKTKYDPNNLFTYSQAVEPKV